LELYGDTIEGNMWK
jgi:hypothetical protein